MTKWEYRILRTTSEELKLGALDAVLNNLGEQGWELTDSSMPINTDNSSPWFVFKRPLVKSSLG